LTANAILILTGSVAVAIIVAKVLGSWSNLRVLLSWRGVASYGLIFTAVFVMIAFYGGKHSGPIFPGSSFRYFAWFIVLVLFLAAFWVGLPRSTQVWLRRNKTGVFKQIRDAHREDD
jgi:hypothetical protein